MPDTLVEHFTRGGTVSSAHLPFRDTPLCLSGPVGKRGKMVLLLLSHRDIVGTSTDGALSRRAEISVSALLLLLATIL